MTLRIVKASEPIQIQNIVLTIYAAPGLWKTSIAQTAEEPITLDFDKGIHRAFNRKASVAVLTWADIAEMNAADLEPYKTVVIDTAGRALDSLAQDIIAGNPKMGRADGTLSLPGFGALKGRFSQWQSFLRSQGKDLILICHMDEQKNGEETLERIDAQGSSKNEIYKSSDAMCRIRLDNLDQRFLDFDPRQGGFGKNPAQLPKILVPNLKDNPQFLARVIAQIKGSINALTEEQAAAVKESEEWAAAIAEADCLDKINVMVKLSKESKVSKGHKSALAEKAKALGFVFDNETKLYNLGA